MVPGWRRHLPREEPPHPHLAASREDPQGLPWLGEGNPERRSPDAGQWGSDTWIMRTLVTLSPSSGRRGQMLAGESTWSMQGVPVSAQLQISS